MCTTVDTYIVLQHGKRLLLEQTYTTYKTPPDGQVTICSPPTFLQLIRPSGHRCQVDCWRESPPRDAPEPLHTARHHLLELLSRLKSPSRRANTSCLRACHTRERSKHIPDAMNTANYYVKRKETLSTLTYTLRELKKTHSNATKQLLNNISVQRSSTAFGVAPASSVNCRPKYSLYGVCACVCVCV